MVLGDEGYHVVHYLEGVAFVVLYGYIGQMYVFAKLSARLWTFELLIVWWLASLVALFTLWWLCCRPRLLHWYRGFNTETILTSCIF
jgi:hypothetical protein